MSPFGWDLPPGVTDAMIEAQTGCDHLPKCPQNEDAEIPFECGGYEEHFCSLIEREINGCDYVERGDCTCPTPAELKLEAAEHRRDLERDR